MKKPVYLLSENHLTSLAHLLEKLLPRTCRGSWAVKLHMGEYGNLNYVRPPIAGLVVSVLKKKGAKPFLFDTTTLYPGGRYTVKGYLKTAKRNGFTQATVGCPIKIGSRGAAVKGRRLKEIFVAKSLVEAGGLVVLSHFKGHPDAGFGGAIKNLGMGAVTRAEKRAVHTLSQPVVSLAKCRGCGTCVRVCPERALKLAEGKVRINYRCCFGCGRCVLICPQKALRPKVASLRELLAEVAWGVVKTFKKSNLLYINVLMSISERCDCLPFGGTDPGRILCPDIGILVAKDIVAVEQASFDLVDKATGGRFAELHGTDPLGQIRAAENLGLGTSEYRLRKFKD